MVKDGEDKLGLQTTNFKKLRLNSSRFANRGIAPLRISLLSGKQATSD